MKRTLAWLLTVIALCIFSLSAIAEQTMTIGISEMGAHPFFASITDGIKSVLEPLGYTFVVKASDYNVTPQIADVEDMVAQKVDAIFFSPYDSVCLFFPPFILRNLSYLILELNRIEEVLKGRVHIPEVCQVWHSSIQQVLLDALSD